MNKEITINGEKYKKVEEEKLSLKPDEGEEYWFIGSQGFSYKSYWEDDDFDKKRYEIGNVYKTREEAEQKIIELKAIQRVKEYIVENFDYHPEKWADWNDNKENKWEICWNADEGKIHSLSTTTNRYYYAFGILKTKEQAEQLIKDKKEDLETIYKPK